MVPCHICHIYGIWRSKEVGDALKSPFGMAMQATSGGGDNFNEEGGGGALCNNAASKLCCKSYWLLEKIS